ncbi:hypothetical protein PHJA_001510700 [Phtheirospermum japonicum]|uniref:Uncharacterized protein n=1 Tax=Phtheirospermum japonicum TaxID=374723 RepID=A0A830CCB2_9LAMI|nr:hypothetical protein PHJA_001510700 [Phtheirospermum japonicum]
MFPNNPFAEQLRLKDEKLEREITQLKHGNKNLKATLSDSETEFHSLKEQILHLSPPNPHKLNFNTHNTVRSKVKVVKREPGLAIQEMKIKAEDNNSNNNKFNKTNSAHELKSLHKETKREGVEKSTWKMDVHAIGVMYKVKRLKQQLMLLERMKGENNNGITGYYGLMSVLNKQVDRYQSLQVKIDDFCMRMHTITRQEDKTKRLEQFLEQTFQLQRYIVATGQKLMQVQAKITASDFLEDTQHIEQPTSFFDINRLADSLKALFQEVQRGIEVRISRIIGDLEATLTCDGFYIR